MAGGVENEKERTQASPALTSAKRARKPRRSPFARLEDRIVSAIREFERATGSSTGLMFPHDWRIRDGRWKADEGTGSHPWLVVRSLSQANAAGALFDGIREACRAR